MRNIKLTIEYDGTNYCGWQIQKNQITIQSVLQSAIKNLTSEDINLIGCSRTDSGVHAKEFIANFHTNNKIPAEKFRDAINFRLPKDIVILKSEEVELNFHSRYSCLGKRYVYTIHNRKIPSALYRNYAYDYKNDVNLEDMIKACEYIKGEHDFSAFKTKGSSVKTSIRNVTELDINKCGDIIYIKISANGFLYNMVRIIVGTLLEVGIGKIKPCEVKDIIKSKDRNKAGKVVPACGLCLEKVFY